MPERTFRKLSASISLRIALPALATIALFILAIFFFLLPQLEQSFMARKQETIKELTETVWSLLESYHEREVLGELSRDEAQKRAILRIHTLRYGKEQKDYFWINDMVPVLIMHPYRPDLEGTDVGGFTDPRGKHLFREFVEVVQDRGAGYVEYMWQWKDNPVKIAPKISYIKAFTPWGWIIGTGIYIDDVYAEIATIRTKLTAVCTLILVVVALLAAYSIRQSMLADRERLAIFVERERLLASLAESNERFRNMLETTSDWIWEMDSGGKYTYASPQLFTLLGYRPEEVIGRSLMDLATPRTSASQNERYQQLLNSGGPFTGFECTCLGKEGQVIVLENNGVPILNGQGSLQGYRGIARDITERKIALEVMKKNRDELHASLEETVASLASTAEKRDPYTAGHQQRVDRLACAIARELDLPAERIEGLHIAALLHDIGKITLPSEYLAKPTRLSPEEQAIIKCHPVVGHEILKTIHFPWPVAEIVHQHHEHLDGSGYPRGLVDEDILLEAKILTVADVVEAMSSHRPYRPALGIARAIEEIKDGCGVRYHGPSVEACLRLIAERKIEFVSEDWCPVFR